MHTSVTQYQYQIPNGNIVLIVMSIHEKYSINKQNELSIQLMVFIPLSF